jgi:hypothetical protein
VGIDHRSKNGYRFLSQLPQWLSRLPFLTKPASIAVKRHKGYLRPNVILWIDGPQN